MSRKEATNNNQATCEPCTATPPIPARVVASVVGSSEDEVRKVRQGKRTGNTPLTQKIQVTDLLLKQKFEIAIGEVKEIVNPQKRAS